MKKIGFGFSLLILYMNLQAQNIGIGTSSPAAKLDVTKPPGSLPTAIFRGSVNTSFFYSGAFEDIHINGGMAASNIILNGAGGTGNVGIKTTNPIFPLTFPGTPGDKISLWNDGTTTHYGLGIQAGLLQMFAKNQVDDIAFGYGSSYGFNETMRIKGNGNVGIGTASPVNRLDISSLGNWDLINTEGDIRLGNSSYRLKLGIALGGGGVGAANIMQQGGANLLSLGSNGNYQIQINGGDNSVNLNNATLKVNGNAGQNGQVLASSGTTPPTWQSLASLLKTFYIYNISVTPVAVNSSSQFELNNATFTLNIDRPSRLIVCATFRMTNNCPLVGSCDGRAWFSMKTDGVSQATSTTYVTSTGSGATNGAITNYFQDVGVGTHTIKFYVEKAPGLGSVDFNAYLQYSTIIALPL